jgi:hypothetical protein
MVKVVPARQSKDNRAQPTPALARRWIVEGGGCAGFMRYAQRVELASSKPGPCHDRAI